MGKGKKTFALGLVAVLLLLGVAGVVAMQRVVAQAEAVTIESPTLAQVADGTYTGSHTIAPVTAEVAVTVQDHAITDIVITRHDTGLGRPAERIVEDVMAQQSLDVDSVSGATVSSRCILKAIEAALEKGVEQ